MAVDPCAVIAPFLSILQAIQQTARGIHELSYNNWKAADSIESAKKEIEHLTNNITLIQGWYNTIARQHSFKFDLELVYQEIKHIHAQLKQGKLCSEYLQKRQKRHTTKLFPKTLISEVQSLFESLDAIGVSANNILPQLKTLEGRIDGDLSGRGLNMGAEYGSHSPIGVRMDISIERTWAMFVKGFPNGSSYLSSYIDGWKTAVLKMTDTEIRLFWMGADSCGLFERQLSFPVLTQTQFAEIIEAFSHGLSIPMTSTVGLLTIMIHLLERLLGVMYSFDDRGSTFYRLLNPSTILTNLDMFENISTSCTWKFVEKRSIFYFVEFPAY